MFICKNDRRIEHLIYGFTDIVILLNADIRLKLEIGNEDSFSLESLPLLAVYIPAFYQLSSCYLPLLLSGVKPSLLNWVTLGSSKENTVNLTSFCANQRNMW